jgi:hypothetical protein
LIISIGKIDNKSIDKRRKLNNSQVITIVIISAKYFSEIKHQPVVI